MTTAQKVALGAATGAAMLGAAAVGTRTGRAAVRKASGAAQDMMEYVGEEAMDAGRSAVKSARSAASAGRSGVKKLVKRAEQMVGYDDDDVTASAPDVCDPPDIASSDPFGSASLTPASRRNQMAPGQGARGAGSISKAEVNSPRRMSARVARQNMQRGATRGHSGPR